MPYTMSLIQVGSVVLLVQVVGETDLTTLVVCRCETKYTLYIVVLLCSLCMFAHVSGFVPNGASSSAVSAILCLSGVFSSFESCLVMMCATCSGPLANFSVGSSDALPRIPMPSSETVVGIGLRCGQSRITNVHFHAWSWAFPRCSFLYSAGWMETRVCTVSDLLREHALFANFILGMVFLSDVVHAAVHLCAYVFALSCFGLAQ